MFHRLYHLLLKALRPRPRNVLCWIAAIALAYGVLINTWLSEGYFTCDFAGQWLMGKMVTAGRATETYWAPAEREVLALGYEGDELKTMDDNILRKCPQGQVHTGVEGPLYPPTMGVLMLPFSLMPPRPAHAVLALLYVQLTFFTGWLIRDITRHRLRVGEATLLVLLFPHFGMGVVLGQNPALTLAILTGGWALWARGWALSGGLVWGLLAFKPVFAIAVLLVPVLLWSVRMLLGLVSGCGLFFLATLVVYGFDLFQFSDGSLALNPAHAWRRWLTVGTNAATVYAYDVNWIWMSRDLISLPRRDMWNFHYLEEHWKAATGQVDWDAWGMQPVNLEPTPTDTELAALSPTPRASDRSTLIGVALVGGVAGLTVLLTLISAIWRRLVLDPPRDSDGSPVERLDHAFGPRPAFILMGALLTCYHFMWYDLLTLALPAALLLADSSRLRWPGRIWLLFLGAGLLACTLNLAFGVGVTSLPFEVFLLLAAWLWAGMRMLRGASTVSVPPSLELNHIKHQSKRVAKVEAQ
jgi:glycosyl transferase family 87